MNYQLAIRQSLVTKIGVYLQQQSRDMSIPLNYNNGIANFQFQDTTYGVVPIQPGQDLFYPGVNLLFLGETDASSGRSASTKKRYLLTVKIIVSKEISGNTRPQIVQSEVLGVAKEVLNALSDGNVEIWNYDSDPVFTGITGWYHDIPYAFTDESIAIAGGDIRASAVIFINYADPS